MYKIPTFTPPAGFVYAISTTSNGDLSFKYNIDNTTVANRERFLTEANILPKQTAVMRVEMGEKIVEIEDNMLGVSVYNADQAIVCDATMTNKKDTALFLLVADCIPIVLFDKKQTALALVHHGLKNTELLLVQKVIHVMQDKYGIQASDLVALLGPAIQHNSYTYEFFDHADDQFWQGFIQKTPENLFKIDNVGKTIQLIQESGVMQENIYNSGEDTYTNRNFFSHKRDYDQGKVDQGRHAMVAMLSSKSSDK